MWNNTGRTKKDDIFNILQTPKKVIYVKYIFCRLKKANRYMVVEMIMWNTKCKTKKDDFINILKAENDYIICRLKKAEHFLAVVY